MTSSAFSHHSPWWGPNIPKSAWKKFPGHPGLRFLPKDGNEIVRCTRAPRPPSLFPGPGDCLSHHRSCHTSWLSEHSSSWTPLLESSRGRFSMQWFSMQWFSKRWSYPRQTKAGWSIEDDSRRRSKSGGVERASSSRLLSQPSMAPNMIPVWRRDLLYKGFSFCLC